MSTCVITLVHGTWGRGFLRAKGDAPWTRDDSAFCRALDARFGLGIVFRRHHWSGGNSHTARLNAASTLREFLRKQLEEYPTATHIVVAHSHGGNVTLMALDDTSLRERIDSVACLATPFISARERDLGPNAIQTFVPALMVLISTIGWILYRWLPASWSDDTRYFVVALPGVLLFPASIFLLRRAKAWADRLRQSLTPVLPDRNHLLIVRSPADEASGVIGFFHLVSELTVRLFLFAEGLYQRLRRIAAKLARRRIALIIIGLIGPPVLLYGAAFAYTKLISPGSPSWVSAVGLFLLFFFLGVFAGPLLVAFKLTNEDALTFMFLLLKSALLWPVVATLSVLLWLPFGWQIAVANVLLNVTAEPTPLGFWEVHLVDPPTSRDLGVSVPHLTHKVYENPNVHALIADWLATRARIST